MKIQSIFVLAVIVLWMGTAADAKYSGGTGEPNNPYRIASAEDLNDIGNHEEDFDKHFILVNDVNLAQYTGTQFNIIGNRTTKFTGVFDGNDHKVWNFTWSSTDRDGIGLFGYIAGGQIKDLGMENVDVNAVNGCSVGGLVGWNYDGTITNCHSTRSVSGKNCVGGLVGFNYSGTLTDCHSTGSVSGTDYGVGGLVGWNYYGTITNCYSADSVTGGYSAGGLVGWNYEGTDGTITNCYSTGSVSGSYAVGGLVGDNSGTIANCYSAGSVTGTQYQVGGLVGWNDYGTITNCYSTGSVIGDSALGGLVGGNGGTITNCYSTGSVSEGYVVGGLVGYNPGGTITNCYSSGSVSGECDVGGLVGINDGTITNSYSTGSASGIWDVGGLVGVGYEQWVTASFWDVNTSGQSTSAGGTPKSTAEMKTKSTFTDAGWDFVEIWGIGENQTYPYLRFAPAGDLNYDEKVNLADFAILASHWLEGTTP